MIWKHQGMRWAPSVCLMTGLALAMVPASYAQTADGETPAVEDICTTWGMTGQVNGLCNAYCEAMDCDDAEPQASETACSRVLAKIEGALGDTPFPTCQDVDNDGVPNGLDNCPDTPNPDQLDANPGTPEGDACEPAIGCPCLVNVDGTPATVTEWIDQAASFLATYPTPDPAPIEACTPNAYQRWPDDTEGTKTVLSFYTALDGGVVPACQSARVVEGTFEYNIHGYGYSPNGTNACADAFAAIVAADPLDVCN